MKGPAPSLRSAQLRDVCVRFAWSDGVEAEFASAWLIDNAPSGFDPVTGQRITTAQSLTLAGPLLGVEIADDTARLEFADHRIEWPGLRLRAHAVHVSEAGFAKDRILWADGINIAERPAISYPDYLGDDEALKIALSEVVKFGLARLSGAGAGMEELERAVRRFGFIRETNYGRMFDVRVVAHPDNLADTARALEPHADNPYRDPVPTLQLLHCIKDSSEGGETFFLDGFALGEWLREWHPEDFARLAGRAVPFAFTTADHQRYEARSPVLRLTVDGRMAGIRFNHRALGAVDFGAAQTAMWYESYLKLVMAANDPQRRFSVGMKPGDIVMFDNERILHGRNAFAGAADRHLKGCYSDRDGLLATLARARRRAADSGLGMT